MLHVSLVFNAIYEGSYGDVKLADQELVQSEPESNLQNQNGEITKITNSQNTKRTYCQMS